MIDELLVKMCNGLSRLKLDELFTVNVKVRKTRGHRRNVSDGAPFFPGISVFSSLLP